LEIVKLGTFQVHNIPEVEPTHGKFYAYI